MVPPQDPPFKQSLRYLQGLLNTFLTSKLSFCFFGSNIVFVCNFVAIPTFPTSDSRFKIRDLKKTS